MVDWALASHLHPFAGAIVLPDKRQQSSGSTPDPRHHFRCFLLHAPYLTEKEKTGRAEKGLKATIFGISSMVERRALTAYMLVQVQHPGPLFLPPTLENQTKMVYIE